MRARNQDSVLNFERERVGKFMVSVGVRGTRLSDAHTSFRPAATQVLGLGLELALGLGLD